MRKLIEANQTADTLTLQDPNDASAWVTSDYYVDFEELWCNS